MSDEMRVLRVAAMCIRCMRSGAMRAMADARNGCSDMVVARPACDTAGVAAHTATVKAHRLTTALCGYTFDLCVAMRSTFANTTSCTAAAGMYSRVLLHCCCRCVSDSCTLSAGEEL